MTFLPLN
jgi:hypothetical protein